SHQICQVAAALAGGHEPRCTTPSFTDLAIGTVGYAGYIQLPEQPTADPLSWPKMYICLTICR
ncbi:MAG: hypothetical protein WBH05_17890, partial [Syntrophobacteria bacterium]